jgi:uncharacterized protein (DUF927 family)
MHVAARLRAVTSTGWFGSTFILPDGAVGVAALDEQFILQTAHVVDHAYNIRGSLIEWQHNIARFAVGNSRLALAISAAFAACLVGPCGAESGGIHFRGRSSVGKTTALNVAGSVWGGGDRGFIRSWRATANGLEATAAAHSDGLLCLDEISQLGGREVGEIAYMLANGQGKARASRETALRKRQVWRLLFLSTGEIGLADKIAEDLRGRRQTAGQQVRVIDLPSDIGKHGLFDHLHGFKNAAVFADHLRGACALYYGTACREFIAAIAPELDETAASAKGIAQQFVDDNCPGDCDGQVKRVDRSGRRNRNSARNFAVWLATAAALPPIWMPGTSTLRPMHGLRSPLASTKRPWPKHSQKMTSSKSPRKARIAPKWSAFQA